MDIRRVGPFRSRLFGPWNSNEQSKCHLSPKSGDFQGQHFNFSSYEFAPITIIKSQRYLKKQIDRYLIESLDIDSNKLILPGGLVQQSYSYLVPSPQWIILNFQHSGVYGEEEGGSPFPRPLPPPPTPPRFQNFSTFCFTRQECWVL